MEKDLIEAGNLIADVQETLAFEDYHLHLNIHESIFEKLAKVSDIIDRVARELTRQDELVKELNFEQRTYFEEADEDSMDQV